MRCRWDVPGAFCPAAVVELGGRGLTLLEPQGHGGTVGGPAGGGSHTERTGLRRWWKQRRRVGGTHRANEWPGESPLLLPYHCGTKEVMSAIGMGNLNQFNNSGSDSLYRLLNSFINDSLGNLRNKNKMQFHWQLEINLKQFQLIRILRSGIGLHWLCWMPSIHYK